MSASFRSRVFLFIFCVSSALSQPESEPILTIELKESAFISNILNHGSKILKGLSPQCVVEFLKEMNLPENDHAFIFNVLKRTCKIFTEQNPQDAFDFMKEFDLFNADGRENMKKCSLIAISRILIAIIEGLTAGPKENYVVPELPNNLRKELYSELRSRGRWGAWTLNPIEKLVNKDVKEFLQKKGVYQDINKKETVTYAEAKKNIELHYGLWRWLLTTSNHPIIMFIRNKCNTRRKQIKYSALIASLFIMPTENRNRVPGKEEKISNPRSRITPTNILGNAKQSTVADEYSSQETEFLLGV